MCSTIYGGYSVATIGSAVATAVGATATIVGTVVLAYAIQSSIVKSARDSRLNLVNIYYMTSYHGAWYANRTSETGWGSNKIYVPASYLGNGVFTAGD